jgi:hypothetical protein
MYQEITVREIEDGETIEIRKSINNYGMETGVTVIERMNKQELREIMHDRLKGIAPNALNKIVLLFDILKFDHTIQGPIYKSWKAHERKRNKYLNTEFTNFIRTLKMKDLKPHLKMTCEILNLSEEDKKNLDMPMRTLYNYLNTLVVLSIESINSK